MIKNNIVKILTVIICALLGVLIFVSYKYVALRNDSENANGNVPLTGGPSPQETSSEKNWAVEGWNNTMIKLNYDADIVFFGDSITCMSDFGSYFENEKIVTLGYPGDNLKDMYDRLIGLIAVKPEKVFIMGGINGLSRETVDSEIEDYTRLIEVLSEYLPDAKIYIQSVLPVSKSREMEFCENQVVEEFNGKVEKMANEKGCTFVNLYPLFLENGELGSELTIDGVHLQIAGYDIWAREIRQYVMD